MRHLLFLSGICVALALFTFQTTTAAPGQSTTAQRQIEGPSVPDLEPEDPILDDEDEESEEFDMPEAIEFRYEQRLDENGLIPPNALMIARQDVDGMGRRPTGPGRNAGITNLSWTPLGPDNIGGRIRSILVHPTISTTMWLGAVGGGIWKTTNGGTSWTPMNDFLPGLAVGCMALDPANPNVLYAGTGEGFFNSDALPGVGILKSTDGGVNWTQIASTIPVNADPTTDVWGYVNRIAISPVDSMVILAATNAGIFRTTNGGTSWTQVFFSRTLDLDFHPTDGLKAISGSDAGRPYYSTDGGATWNAATLLGGGRVEVAYARSSPTTVYASANVSSGQVWQSLDGGVTYALKNTGRNYLGSQGWYDNALWVDPTNPARLVVGGIDCYKSTNSGTTLTKFSNWQNAPLSAHADHHVMVQDANFNGTTNNRVYFGNDGGIYVAPDVFTAGLSSGWTSLNNNLAITQFYGGAVRADLARVVGGTQDNGSLASSGTLAWTSFFGGDGGQCSADALSPAYVYGEYVYCRIHRSANGGNIGEYIYNLSTTNPLTDAVNASALFISPFVVDPNNGNRILAGCSNLWRTNNAKATAPAAPDWFIIKNSIGSSVSTITIAEGNPDIIWVGHTNGNVYKTANGTAASPTWTQVDNNPSALPNRYCTRIAIARNNPNKVYVTFSGYSANNIYRTSDGGSNWTQITGPGAPGTPMSLPRAPINALAIHPVFSSWIYVGTDIGVFASTDDGATWSSGNDGPANVAVDHLMWRGPTKLVAATHGRSMFEATLDVSTADCNGNAVPDATDIINGAPDCNGNGILDSCEIAANPTMDCNGNTILDSCEFGYGDCDGDEITDLCELAGRDCDNNGLLDSCELSGTISPADSCSLAPRVTSGVAYTGTNAGSTNDGVDACNAGGATPPDVWYQYIPVSSGSATISLCGTLFDAVLSVHSGCPGTLVNAIQCADDSCGVGSGGIVTIPVTAGVPYFIRITGYANPPSLGDTGTFVMKITGPPGYANEDCNGNAVLDACEPALTGPAVTVPPSTTAACVGGSASFSVTAIGQPTLLYQWRKGLVPLVDGGNIRGSGTATLMISPVGPADVASDYNCLVTNACKAVASSNAALSVIGGGSGDGNFDAVVNGTDVKLFVSAALSGGPASATYCAFDMDGNGVVNELDIPAFVALALLP